MEWAVFALLAALFWAMSNIIDKYVLTKLVKHPVVPLMILGIVGFVLSVLIYFFIGFSELSVILMLLGLFNGALYIVAVFFYYKATQIEEISRLAPLLFTTPIFVMIFGFLFLGELFTTMQYAGVMLLVFGAILVTIKGSLKVSFDKAFFYIIMAAIVFSANLVIIKYLLEFADYLTIFSITKIGTFLSILPLIVLQFDKLKANIREKGYKAVGMISFNEGVITQLGNIFLILATSIGFATLVNALTSVQVLFVLLMSLFLSIFYPHIIKEDIGKRNVLLKTAGTIAIITGGFMVL